MHTQTHLIAHEKKKREGFEKYVRETLTQLSADMGHLCSDVEQLSGRVKRLEGRIEQLDKSVQALTETLQALTEISAENVKFGEKAINSLQSFFDLHKKQKEATDLRLTRIEGWIALRSKTA